MPRRSRSGPPTGRGPGRGSPQTRTSSRPAERAAKASSTAPADFLEPAAENDAPLRQERINRGLGMTRRAIALIVVLSVLIVSYASSLRVYLRQQQEMAIAREQIVDRERSIEALGDEVKRWQDPEFVKTQARERLGWVVPGEVGYRVLGPDGKLLGGGAEIDSADHLPDGEHSTMWWEKVLGSMVTADKPEPVATKDPVITENSTPTPTPTR